MKLKKGFVLSSVAGETVVLPTEDVVDLNVMITLNETAKFLWEHLEEETDLDGLVAALLSEYEVDAETARFHAAAFVKKLEDNGLLE